MEESKKGGSVKAAALHFIVLMGVVSLFSDVTHEGGKSIIGAYLNLSGAPAAAIGFIAGFGELLGYSLRYITGRIADRTKKYWALTIAGYAIDLLAVPLLALIPNGGWMWAALLIAAERTGKAIKKPAKDTLLSFAAAQNGVGKSFALQEFLDQLGAFAGPAALFLAMYFKGTGDGLTDYRRCFALLLFPALATLALLLAARHFFPAPEDFEADAPKASQKVGSNGAFTLYIVGISLFALGFMDFSLVTMHVSRRSLLPAEALPLLYAGAMAVDAVSALVFGWLYDKRGLSSLVWPTLLTSPFALFVFLMPQSWGVFAGAALWGVGMGAQESVLKAAVAALVPKEKRGSGYGLFQTAFGACLFLGSWLAGWLYDRSLFAMFGFSFAAQIAAALVFYRIGSLRGRKN